MSLKRLQNKRVYQLPTVTVFCFSGSFLTVNKA